MMGPLELLAGYLLLRGSGAAGADSSGWKQLPPNSKGQYAVPAGALFIVDVSTSVPVAPLLAKQLSDLGGQVFPPTVAASAMPIDWPASDDTRTQTGRMRGAAKAKQAIAVDMGTSPNATRVWVKNGK